MVYVRTSDEITCSQCGRSVSSMQTIINLFRKIAPSKLDKVAGAAVVDIPLEIVGKLKCKKCGSKSAAFHKTLTNLLHEEDLQIHDPNRLMNEKSSQKFEEEHQCLYLRWDKKK